MAKQSRRAIAKEVVARWGGDAAILEEGFLPVPIVFLKHMGSVGLTPAEAMFILQLMVFKWDEHAPYPSYKTLSTRMGVSKAYVRKIGYNLDEEKDLLKRIDRKGTTNQFDLRPFFRHLTELVKTEADSEDADAVG